jgi:MFS family permease
MKGHWKELGRDYKLLLIALLVFTLGNSTDAFLLLRLSDAGIPASWIAVLWSTHHIIKMIATYVGGRLTDTLGPRRMIIGGWFVYASTYLAFALVSTPTSLIAVFLAYGIYFGLTEPSEKTWVAAMVPARLRGTAFGYYHSVIGLGALPASILFGFLWHSLGPTAAFGTGAGLAVGASLLLFLVKAGMQDEECLECERPAEIAISNPSRMPLPRSAAHLEVDGVGQRQK